ncbi:hypothetical protein [Streptomyces sp. NBC_00134]|uniref:hypothetical protein n=1 Tax=Streptomyces sp. NBC_00134 TaxID=2975663 RepID=UPI0032551093
MTRCPRCAGELDDRPARSRTTTGRDRVICSPCGTVEALRDATGRAPVPPNEWPHSGN